MRNNGNGLAELERRLWAAADQLWANSSLRPSEYSGPVLGLIFLRFADNVFTRVEAELKGKATGRRAVGKLDYQAKGVLYLPDEARFSRLLNAPEGADTGKALNEAMKAVEGENEDLKGVLPKTYQRSTTRAGRTAQDHSGIPLDLPGDAFGKIYEYFLGEFAMTEGQKGGEFFTPTEHGQADRRDHRAIPRTHARPGLRSAAACSCPVAAFVRDHKKNPSAEISIYGQETRGRNLRLCKMNLAVHGLSGDIRQGNTYYEDLHNSVGKFDFVMANPPFNVDRRGQRAKSRTTRASRSGCRTPTTPTISGFRFSTAR